MSNLGGRWALVLSDGKPGHENQSLGVLPKGPDGIDGWVFTLIYRSKTARLMAWLAARLPSLSGLLIGRFPWSGIIADADRLADRLADRSLPLPEVVLSSGSGPAPMTLHLAHHLKRPAVTCMTPSIGLSRFDLALVPRHDNPPEGSHVVTTLGAPNRVDCATLVEAGKAFKARHQLTGGGFISLLLGGDAAHHAISPETGVAILKACIELGRSHGMGVLVTTSRRTREETESAMFGLWDQAAYFCRGRSDREPVLQGMLGLASIVVVTEDSVSMVSEAASSLARVLTVAVVADGARPPKRHEAVVSALAEGGYLRRTTVAELEQDGTALLEAPLPPVLDDTARCQAALLALLERAS